MKILKQPSRDSTIQVKPLLTKPKVLILDMIQIITQVSVLTFKLVPLINPNLSTLYWHQTVETPIQISRIMDRTITPKLINQA